MALKRHARANNPLVEGYDPGQPSSHILYLDANNLYGWAMSQYLPTSAFRWMDDCQQLAKTIAEQPDDSPEGYILEVDLEYPEDLHDAQFISAGTRAHGGSEGVDVGVSAQPPRRWGGANRC